MDTAEKYLPLIKKVEATFNFDDGNYSYDLFDKSNKDALLKRYKALSDVSSVASTKEDEGLVFNDSDWSLKTTNGTLLKKLYSENTLLMGFVGLIPMNYAVFHDEENGRYVMMIHPHLGGDIRGNYASPLFLIEDDLNELAKRFFSDYINGYVELKITFNDKSFIDIQTIGSFASLFSFVTKASGETATQFNHEIFSMSSLEETDEAILEIIKDYQVKKSTNDLSKFPLITVKTKSFSFKVRLDKFDSGEEVVKRILDEISGFHGGSNTGASYQITEMTGFGSDTVYSKNMTESDFDIVINAYKKYTESDFPSSIVSDFKYNHDIYLLSDAINTMNERYRGAYASVDDFVADMINEGMYEVDVADMSMNDEAKLLIASEKAQQKIAAMTVKEVIEFADAKMEFDNKELEFETKISDVQDRIDILEFNLSRTDGDEFDKISEAIAELEEEKSDLIAKQQDMPAEMAKENYNKAIIKAKEEYYAQITNDLGAFIEEYDIEVNTDVSPLALDKEKAKKELMSKHEVYFLNGKHFIFANDSLDGKKAFYEVGKAPLYNYYVVEMNAKKLLKGFETRKEADAHKRELFESISGGRFNVYSQKEVQDKLQLDLRSHVSFGSPESFKYGGNVALRSGYKPKVDEEIWKTSEEIKEKLSTETDVENKKALRSQLSKLKEDNYEKVGSYAIGGEVVKKKVHPSSKKKFDISKVLASLKRGTIKGIDIAVNLGSGLDDAYKSSKKTLAKTAAMAHPTTRTVATYQAVGATPPSKSYQFGGDVMKGKTILFNDFGKQSTGRILDELGEGEFSVISGKGFSLSKSLVKGENIIKVLEDEAYQLYQDGGSVGLKVGQPVRFADAMGQQRDGMILEVLPDNNFVVESGSGFTYKQSLVRKSNLVSIDGDCSTCKKNKVLVYDRGGDVTVEEQETSAYEELDEFLSDSGVFGYTDKIHAIMIGESDEFKPNEIQLYLNDPDGNGFGIFGYDEDIRFIYTNHGLIEEESNVVPDNFTRALETDTNIYYVDFDDTDDKTNTLAVKKSSGNVLGKGRACSELMVLDIWSKNYIWMADELKESERQIDESLS